MTETTGSFTARLIAAVDATWAEIRARHADVPEVVITLGTGAGVRAGQALKLGHFHAGTWERSGVRLPELFLGGEGFRLGPLDLLGTLLHEAAHGVGSIRGIQDTSRQGRWHNDRYRLLAVELGLDVAKDASIGWSLTTVPAATATAYESHVKALEAALTTFRHPNPRGRSNSNNGVSASCGCGRRIRVSESVLDQAPITCGACGTEFR